MSGTSGALHCMASDPSVTMVREDVHITGVGADPKVTARFVFHNTAAKAVNTLIGFPELLSGGDAESPSEQTTLQNFRSWVDGKPIALKYDKQASGSTEDGYQAFWVKTVHFDAGQTHIVTDSYTGGGGNYVMGEQWFIYVLKTGASWKGPIGEAVVTCDVGNLSTFAPVVISPGGYSRKGDTVTWDLKNIKPAHDINISWFPAFTQVLVNGKPVIVPESGASADEYSQKPFLLPGYVMWDTQNWGYVYSQRRGSDVWLAAKTAAAWLGGKLAVEQAGRVDRIERGGRWVQITVGSRELTTSDGRHITMPEPAQYRTKIVWMGSPQPGRAYTMVSLPAVAQALGGTVAFDTGNDVMSIRF
jgi:hypothetical protein